MTRVRALSLWAVVGVAAVSSACTPSRGADAGGTAPPGLNAVALPDLSSMAPTVQRQIRERHDGVTTAARAGGPPEALVAANGELGKIAMAAQLGDVATAAFSNARALAPRDHRWPYYLAQLARTAGDLAKARPLFEETITLAPDDVAARVWLGEVTLALGQPVAAKPHFERALALQATSLSARFGLGRVALAEGRDHDAIALFEAVLAQDPEAAAVHYPLSTAYGRVGEAAKAAIHVRQRREHEILPADPLMVELDTLLDSPQTHETLGIRALNDERWAEAAAAFRRGLALAPDSAALHHRLGTALRMSGDHAGAMREFEAATAADPSYFPAQYSLGVVDQAAGRDTEAIARFAAALSARPTYTEARVRLGDSLRRVGRAGEALAAYDEALAADGPSVEVQLGRGLALIRLGRWVAARTALGAAHTAAPERPDVAHALARVLAAAPAAAARDGRRALELAQGLVAQGRTLELGETTAMALAELGEFGRAVGIQRDLLAAAERGGLTRVTPRLQRNLSAYERGEPCRTPWDVGELP